MPHLPSEHTLNEDVIHIVFVNDQPSPHGEPETRSMVPTGGDRPKRVIMLLARLVGMGQESHVIYSLRFKL